MGILSPVQNQVSGSNCSFTKLMARERELDQQLKMERKNTVKYVINLVWDCLCPIARKNLLSWKNLELMKTSRFFEYLSLDNKVEFFGYKWNDDYK